MEALDKKLTEGFQGMLDQMQKMNSRMDNMNVDMNTKMDDINSRMGNMKDELKKEVSDLRTEIKKEVEDVKKDNVETAKKVQALETQMKNVESKKDTSEETIKRLQTKVAQMECKMTENHIRIRGLPESSKVLKQEIIELVAEYIEKTPEEIAYLFDRVYRIRSDYAVKHKLPRDVVVTFLTSEIPQKVLATQFENPLMVDGSRLRFMRELPRKILMDRKKYRKLTTKLTEMDIRFKWEIPEGLTFELHGKRLTITSAEEITSILKDLDGEDQGAAGGQ